MDGAAELDEARCLRLDLVLATEDVAVVLGEGAHPHQAVQRAGRFVAVAGAHLGHADRQLAVATLAPVEDLDVAGAVHRLQRQGLALHRLADEHVLPVLVPVTGLLPEGAVEHLGRLHLDIAAVVHPAAHVGLQRAPQRPALGVPEHHAPALFLHMEQVHGAAELPVVALLRLLDAVQIGFEVGLARPGGAVDALELGVLWVAPPVGAGELGQLERLAHEARRRQVRPAAEVLPAALVIDGDGLALRQVGDDFGLVGLSHRLEAGGGGVAVQHLAHDPVVAVDDLAHLRFDPGQVVQAERLGPGEVVVEAVLDRRADGHLGAREQLLHRLGHHVGGVVAQGVEQRRVVAGEDLQPAAALQRPVQIEHGAVEPHDRGLLGQRLRQALGDRAAGGPLGIVSNSAVGEGQLDHASHFRTAGRAGGGS